MEKKFKITDGSVLYIAATRHQAGALSQTIGAVVHYMPAKVEYGEYIDAVILKTTPIHISSDDRDDIISEIIEEFQFDQHPTFLKIEEMAAGENSDNSEGETEEDDRLFSVAQMYDFALRMAQEAMAAGFSQSKGINGISLEEYIEKQLNDEAGI